MQVTSAGYTGGEIIAMVAPLFDLSPEDVNHAAVIVFTSHGEMEMVGCKHAAHLARMVAENATQHAFNSRSHYESHLGKKHAGWFRNWLGSILL